jgi:esterase/lipase superfamily enzyme
MKARTRCLAPLFLLSVTIGLLLGGRPCSAQVEIPITIDGKVVDAAGQPLSGVIVTAGSKTVTSGADGGFKVDLAVTPGTLDVTASLQSDSRISTSQHLEVTGPGILSVTLVLPVTAMFSSVEDLTTSGSGGLAGGAAGPSDLSILSSPPPPPPPPPSASSMPAAPITTFRAFAAEAAPITTFGTEATTAGVSDFENPPLTAQDRAVVRVLYATDRKPTGNKATYAYYSGEWHKGELQLGVCEVSIPIVHIKGVLESPSILHFERRPRRGKHVVVLKITLTDRDHFLGELQREIGGDPRKQLLVFVHGFNVSFLDAVRRTAQLSFDLDFTGAPLLYSWPSRAELSGYMADEDSVRLSTRHFQDFLVDLVKHSGAARIYVLAHSMGSRMVANAVFGLVESRALESLPSFKQVIFAAPDIGRNELAQLAQALRSASGRVTVYANSKDEAIRASAKLHKAPRAGSSGPDLFFAEGIDSIDASDTDTGFLQHGYYANAILLRDLHQLFESDAPPPRTGMIKKFLAQRSFWSLGGKIDPR